MNLLRAMHVFLQVADGRSLTAAARRLGVSLASVSRELAALEAHLGCALFLRSTRSLSLTEHGHLFYERARKIAHDVRDAELAVRPPVLEPTGRIGISAPALLGRHLLAPILPSYLKAYPKVQVDAVLSDRDVNLIEDGVDIALHIGTLGDSSLLNDRVWRYRSGSGARMAVGVNVRFRANALEAVVAAALGGAGITRAPLWYVADHVKAGRLKLVLQDYERPTSAVHALFPASRAREPAVHAFVDMLTKRLVLRSE
jgi:DNA-binding transcriptional LysR family regulator